MPIAIFMACPRPACAFSPSTVRGAAPTWRCSSSPRPSPKASRSDCSITAACGAISPMSTTSSRRSSASSHGCRRKADIAPGGELDPATSPRRGGFTISATTAAVEISPRRRDFGAGIRPQGQNRTRADAARRRAGDLRRRRRSDARRRFSPLDADRTRRAQIRRLVSRLSSARECSI